jgi:hypothetical protein
MLATVGRLILFVLVSLGLERVTQAMSGRDGLDSMADIFSLLRQATVLASGLTIIPALALVIVGEVARIRGSMYYVLGGGLALAVVPLLARYGQSGTLVVPAATVWQVFATAGFAGGFVYWLIAGRGA